MFDFNGDGVMDRWEEYLAFRIWEEACGISGDEGPDDREEEEGSSPFSETL